MTHQSSKGRTTSTALADRAGRSAHLIPTFCLLAIGVAWPFLLDGYYPGSPLVWLVVEALLFAIGVVGMKRSRDRPIARRVLQTGAMVILLAFSTIVFFFRMPSIVFPICLAVAMGIILGASVEYFKNARRQD